MLVKITTYNNTVYKFASKTTDTSDGIYLGRLRDDLSLTSMASVSGTVPASQNLTIYNADNYISKSENFWGASLLLTQENGLTWLGKVTFFNFDSDGNLYLTASEKGAPELELQLPDEVRQVYTIDDNFHQSSVTMTIPLVIGGTHSNPITLSTILIDKTRGIYLICVGEIREIVTVYNGTEALPRSAYIPYRGWSTQTEHPGFAYIQLEEPYRYNSDGSYAEINVDVVGLKLGEHTAEECRNGARFLLWFLKTASSGINGWGCGIPESEIDVASFNSAISLVDLMGLKLDGIMWLRQSAQNWIDQICQAIHGSYSIGSNGKRKLTIDYAGAASKKTFNASKIILNKYGKDSYVSTVYNKGILSYGYNPITGLFMQSAQFENADSIAQIGEQKFVGESYLIQDASTALAILEYNCKKSLSSAEAIDFTTDDLTTDLFAGDIITLDRSDIGITGEFQITSISTSDTKSEITAVRFDRSVFTVTGSQSNVVWGDDRDITPAMSPAQATNLLLSTGFDINQDGTGNPYISGTFTVPEGGWLAAAVQYGIGANPTNYTELALITEGRFKIQPVNVGTVYTIRVRMITATGHSDYITGQITSTGDTVAPDIPTIVLNSTEKSVIVKCAIDNPPNDMGGFQIHRKKHSESVYTLIGNVAANRGYASFADYVDEWVAYDYKAKSYDRSGNLSDFSDVKTVTITGIQANDVAATALKIPTGSILRLSAKGCTTDSIKQTTDSSGNPVYGVKDVSGYNHHGQAYGNVTVLDGGEGFSFDGRSGYLKLREYSSLLQHGEAWTIVGRFKPVAGAVNAYPRMFGTTKYNIEGSNANSNSMKFNVHDGTTQTQHSLGSDFLPFDEEHHAVFVQDGETLIIYKDGVEFTRFDCGYVPVLGTEIFFIGKQTDGTSQCFKGTIKDFRIYPRALSATEVKSMYMLPDEAIFGQLNADLIGANVINASNLVKTQALITESAQISQAVVNNLNVTGNATFQSGLTNTLNSAKSDAAAKVKVVTDNIYTANTTTINGGKITTGSITAGAIAANAVTAEKINAGAITAEKITVAAGSLPTTPSIVLKAQAGYFASGSYVGDTSGLGNRYKLSAAFTSYSNANLGYMWRRTSMAASAIVLVADQTVSIGASFTFSIIYNISDWSAQPVFFDAKAADNANRVTIYATTGRVVKVAVYNASGTATTITLGTCSNGAWRRLTVVCNAGTWTSYDSAYTASTATETVSATTAAHAALTATAIAFGNLAASASASRGFIGYLGHIFVYNYALSKDQHFSLVKHGMTRELGTITADRVSTDIVKSRNYDYSSGDFSTAGTFLNLANGAITSKNFCVKSDGSAKFKGNIEASSGTIAGLTINTKGLTYSQAKGTTEESGFKITQTINSAESQTAEISYLHYQGGTYITPGFRSVWNRGSSINKIYGITISAYEGGKFWQSAYNGTGLRTTTIDSWTSYFNQGGNSTDDIIFGTGKIHAHGFVNESDREIKNSIKSVNTLNRLKQIGVYSWRYDENKRKNKEYKRLLDEYKLGKLKTEPVEPSAVNVSDNPLRIGVMAQDFNKAFGVNLNSNDNINITDTIGVALRAIQELSSQLDNAIREIRRLKRILKSQNIITDEIVSADKDSEAIRRLEIAKARQARRDEKIQKEQNDTDKEPTADENNITDTDNTNDDGLC